MIEVLEPRIAPAAVFTYNDIDGDTVTVTTSKGTSEQLENVASFVDGRLQLILTNIAFQGTNVSIVAKRHPVAGGDGFVNVEMINATGRDLGTVFVDGDLHEMNAGDGVSATPAIKLLTVQSMGHFDSGLSQFDGAIGKILVKNDWQGECILSDSGLQQMAHIGSISIGGNCDGIFIVANLGSVKIRGDLDGEIIAGNIGTIAIGGSFTGSNIDSGSRIGKLSIAGDFTANGTISSGGPMGKVFIGGNVVAATQEFAIDSGGSIASVTIGGTFSGGGGGGSISARNNLGPVKIGGDLDGRTIPNSAGPAITSEFGSIASVTIGGSMLGGQSNSAFIFTGFNGGSIGPVKIGGHVIGGAGSNSASISSSQTLGPVFIGGSVIGGGDFSARIRAEENIASVTIGGDLVAGSGEDSGLIAATGTLGKVLIKGSVLGAAGVSATNGSIYGQSGIGSVIIGHDLRPGEMLRGTIVSGKAIGSVLVKGSIVSDPTGQASAIIALGSANPTSTTDVAIGRIKVLGSVEGVDILAGYLASPATLFPLNADAQIGSITVKGEWREADIAAGVLRGADAQFGTLDDAKPGGLLVKDTAVVSRIGAIKIAGQVFGSLTTPGDVHGFVAEQISVLTIGGTRIPFTTAANEFFRIGSTGGIFGNVFAREDV
jgi:hypothetical protein